MSRHRLCEQAWHDIHVVLKRLPAIHANDEDQLRRFVEAVVFVLRTGIPWSALPPSFGNADAVRQRFRRWRRLGVWRALAEAFGMGADAAEEVMIDGTVCKAHRAAAGARGGERAATGHSRGGLTSKVVAAVDGAGRILRYRLLPGQAAESPVAPELFDGVDARRVIADKAYDTDAIRKRLRETGIEPVIPFRRNRRNPEPIDRAAYARRHVVENVFCRLKDNIRIAHRLDKTADSYEAFIDLAVALHNRKYAR